MTARQEGGREFIFGQKVDEENKPLITIITSTYNAVNDLPWTIKSIREQTYPNIQWIIADGGSSDGTVDLLKQNEDIIDYWFSEPDEGIYDAWQKTIDYINGEWVQFLGAGDELKNPDVYLNLIPMLLVDKGKHKIIYGSLELISEKDRRVLKIIDRPWDKIKNKWDGFRPKLPIHPEVIHHHSIINKGCFGDDYKIAGDSFLLLSTLVDSEPMYKPICITKMQYGGISTELNNIFIVANETRRISKELGFKIPVYIYIKEILKIYLKKMILKLGNEKLYFYLADKYISFKKLWGIS